jgi:hypothetical protein
LLPVVVLHDEIRFTFFNGPGRREAAQAVRVIDDRVSPPLALRAMLLKKCLFHWGNMRFRTDKQGEAVGYFERDASPGSSARAR